MQEWLSSDERLFNMLCVCIYIHVCHIYVYAGEVERVLPGDAGVVVKLRAPIKRGDGVVFDRGAPEEPEEGGHVYEVLGVTHARACARAHAHAHMYMHTFKSV